MTDRSMFVNGCPIFVRDNGPAKAPPVLLLHSLFFDGTMFDGLCQRLGPHFRVLRPDHRGQGRSQPTSLPASMDQLASDMIALLEQIAIGPVHIVGSSMGAYVAMRILAQRSDLVATAALLCCTAEAERDLDRFLSLVERLRSETPAHMTDVIANTMFGSRFLSDPACEKQRQTYTRWFATLPVSVADAAYHVFSRKGSEETLAAYRRPLLLVGGALDNAKRPSDMERIAEIVPGSRLVIIQNSGHTPAVEAPDALAEALLAWWSETQVASNSTLAMEVR